MSLSGLLHSMALASMFLSGSVYLTDQYRFAHLPLLGLSVLLFFLAGLEPRTWPYPVWLVMAFGSMSFFMIISGTVSKDMALLARAAGLLLVGLCTLVVHPGFGTASPVRKTYALLMWTHVPILVVTASLHGVTLRPYQGIFYNPNAFGTIVATLFSASVAHLFGLLFVRVAGEPIKYGRIAATALLTAGLFYEVVISQSRTAFLACIIVLAILAVVYLPSIRRGKLRRAEVKTSGWLAGLIVAGSCAGLVFELQTRILRESVLSKFLYKAAAGDALDGRGRIWLSIIAEARILGGKRDLLEIKGLGAHSSYISLLGQYGWIVMILFVAFLLLSMYYAVRYARLTRFANIYAAVPVASIVAFGAMSVTEGMMLMPSMYMAFLLAAEAYHGCYRKTRNLSAGK